MMIGDEGAKILADSLCSTETLTTLRLDDNGISDEGAKTIFEALKYNTTLTTFGMISEYSLRIQFNVMVLFFCSTFL